MIFDSRKLILEDILKTLRDCTKNSISIYGFGGMGKTTLAKQVASQAAEEKIFEKIVMASVTQRVDVKQIQEQIASMLNLKLEDSTVAERAVRIHKRLKGKKVLVILNNLWEELDLEEVGIPFGANHMGCKLLLTSRFRHVLTLMGIQEQFRVGPLDEEESWRLFKEKTGPVSKIPDFHNIGREVVKRCEGFPVLIVTVAASLSKRPQLSAWNDALRQLREMNNKQMHEIVNSAMKNISYNHLEKTHKQLFLLCGIMGGEASVEQLLQYSWSLGLFSEEAVTVQEARDRLHSCILDLKESCLLLDGYGRSSIKMHGVVRDVAISIAHKELNMFSIREYDAEWNMWHKGNDLKKCTAIVFHNCHPHLPQQLECPLLELFILSGFSSYSSPTIPDTFFGKTNKLKVLGMSQLSFSALPPSIWFLKNLQTLRVNNCYGLKDISVVGELKTLQILSFAGSNIEELPSGIGKLSDLRVLNLTGCSQLKVVPVGLIAGLTRLEELYMSKSFDRWEAQGLSSSGRRNAILVELSHLHNLSTLEIKVNDAKLLYGYRNVKKLGRYEIIGGGMWAEPWFDEPEITRKICVQLSTTSSINHFLQHPVMTLLKITEGLCLGELKGVKNVIPEIDKDGFPCLKHFHIQTDYEIEYIVDTEVRQRIASFPELESLHLSNMLKLKKICNGRLMEGSFCNLTRLIVEKCDSLKYLFTPSIANEEETIIETVLFPQLRYLCLEELTNLTTFYSGVEEMNSNKSVQPLFNEKVKIPNLRRLEISGLDSITTIWHNHLFEEDSFFQLKQITVKNCASLLNIFPSFMSKLTCLKEVTLFQCGGIKHIFPISMAASFHWLEKLTIEDCEVETVFDDLEEIKAEVEFVFSKLDRLYLRRLPKLECFYPREHTIQCPALKEFRISNCDKVSALNFLNFQGNQFQKVISNLEFLSIRGRDIMKMEREDDHLPPNVFATVERLVIKDFDDKSASFPSKFLHRFEKVTRLSLYDCSFKEIFPYEGDGSLVVSDGAKKLRELKLSKLPELESICKQDSPLIPILENLILSLQVWECPRLTNLVPSSVSFRVLTHLEICNCGGLINLIQSPITTMAQLQVLRVGGCEMLEAMIAGDESGHDIIFNELRVLELARLPRLRNFCPSPCHNFQFPLLEEINVEQCPNMTTFCGGTIITPKLKKIYMNQFLTEEHWEGDLNTPIQKIFAEMEDRRLTARLPATRSGSHFAELTEPGKESHNCEIGNQVKVSKNATDPRKEDKIYEYHVNELGNNDGICEGAINPENEVEVSEPRKGIEISEEVGKKGDNSENAQGKELEVSEREAQLQAPKETKKALKDDKEEEELMESRKYQFPGEGSCLVSPDYITQQIEERNHEVKEDIKQEYERKLEAKEQAMIKRRSNEFDVCENVVEPRKEDNISENHVKELGDKAEICDDAINPENEVEVSEPRKGTEICEGTNHSQDQTITASIASQRVVDSSSQSSPRISNNPEIYPSFATETTTSIATASSRNKDLLKIMDDDASPDISTVNLSMVPNVDKANKGLLVEDRAKASSERKLKIAEIAAQLQALEKTKKTLQETKKSLEDQDEEELMASRKLGEGS